MNRAEALDRLEVTAADLQALQVPAPTRQAIEQKIEAVLARARRALRREALELHPDRCQGLEAVERDRRAAELKALTEAMAWLSKALVVDRVFVRRPSAVPPWVNVTREAARAAAARREADARRREEDAFREQIRREQNLRYAPKPKVHRRTWTSGGAQYAEIRVEVFDVDVDDD